MDAPSNILMFNIGLLVTASFLIWAGLLWRLATRPALLLLGVGAVLSAGAAFYHLFLDHSAAYVFMLTSTALANLGAALHRRGGPENDT